MRQKSKNIILGLIPFIVLLLVWSVVTSFGLAPKWILPSPAQTMTVFLNLFLDGTLFSLVWVSLQNVLIGFFLACIFGFILGVPMGTNLTVYKIFFPFLSSIYTVPSLAWLPFIIMTFGFTRQTVIVVIFISSFKKIIYSVVGGVRNVNVSWLLAAKNMGLNKLEIIYKIILPASLPHLMTGIRMGFGSAWKSLVGAEMLVASVGGLGKFIWIAQWYFDFSRVFCGIIVISLIGVAVEQLIFKPLENKTLVKWGFVQEDT